MAGFGSFIPSTNVEDRRDDSAIKNWSGALWSEAQRQLRPTLSWGEIKAGLQNPLTPWQKIISQLPEAYPVTPLGVQLGIHDVSNNPFGRLADPGEEVR